MNRRESIKALTIGSLSTGLLLETACNPAVPTQGQAENTLSASDSSVSGRQPFETELERKLNAEKFFTTDEMACITILGDIIIPKDEHSGSASDAKVPDFIEFIVKDMPHHQVPMRGGLRWLNLRSATKFGNSFASVTSQQQLELVNEIAWPEKAKPEVTQGVAFFNHMRDLVATGFFTSEIGIKDIGYMGNKPNQWKGVPPEIIKQYGLEGV